MMKDLHGNYAGEGNQKCTCVMSMHARRTDGIKQGGERKEEAHA